MLDFAMVPKKSGAAEQSKMREISLPISQISALEARRDTLEIPVAGQIRAAIRSYLRLEPITTHRLLVKTDEELSRNPVSVPDSLWDSLKARKAKTKLDLNELVQIAVALYLKEEEASAGAQSQSQSKNQSQGTAPPTTADDMERFRRLAEEVFTQKAPTLLEQLRAEGKEVWPAVPALMQVTRTVPVTMTVSCGTGDDLDNIVEPLESGGLMELTGKLAEKVTEHSFIARAVGWSMSNDGSPFSIQSGDLLLMTPIEEFKRTIKKGTIVLARVRFKDGRTVQTLKAYDGRRLRANNPDFRGLDFGPNVEQATVVAVCRGVLEKVFD